MTPSPSPFSIGQAIGGQIGQVQERQTDLTALDQILAQAGQSEDPRAIDVAINQVMSRVSPQRQGAALDLLQGKKKDILEQKKSQQERQAYRDQGLDPSLRFLPPGVQTQKVKSLEAQTRFDQIVNPQVNQVTEGEPVKSNTLRDLNDDQLIQLSGVPEYSTPAREELRRRQEDVKASQTAFEPESEKLEARRVSELATEIEKDFRGAQSENMRLGRSEKLDEKGNLSTPLMVKTLNALGLPIGVLSNPDSEEYVKIEADYLRDVRNVFPGGRVTNYEVQAYLKGIPTLLNTPEGRRAIVRNRRLINEAKILRYDTYKEIIKENNGVKPRNLGILLEERIQDRMNDIQERFIDGITDAGDKFQVPIRMIDPQGRVVNIPPSEIEAALNGGAKFQ